MSAGPPRGIARSTRSSSCSKAKVAARSDVGTTCAAAAGSPAFASPSENAAASASEERSASEPGRRIAAFPLFRQSAAASTVTFGRASYTMRTTPSGMRTFFTASPFGRRQLAVTWPTGSGSAATSRRVFLIPSSRFSSSASRSRKAALCPAFRAASTSFAFSARIRRARRAIASAATRRATPPPASSCPRRGPGSLPSASRSLPARLEQDEIVPVDDFVEVLIPERALDLARLQARDAAHLVGAVAREAPSKGAGGVDRDVDRIPHLEAPLHRPHARRQERPPGLDERLAGARVDEDDPLAARGGGEPPLARGEPICAAGEHGPDPLPREERVERARPAPGEERRRDALRGETARGLYLGRHAADAPLVPGAARHPLDVRGDARHVADERRPGRGGAPVVE